MCVFFFSEWPPEVEVSDQVISRRSPGITYKNRNASGWRQQRHIHSDRTDPGLIRTRTGLACSTAFTGGAPLAQLVECRTRLGRKGRGVVYLSKTLHLHCLVLIVRLSLLRKTILIPEILAFMCVCVFVDGCISQF